MLEEDKVDEVKKVVYLISDGVSNFVYKYLQVGTLC